MAGTVIEVDTTKLNGDVSTIHSELSGLKKDVTNLKDILNQLSAMWDGNAKRAFSDAVNSDMQRLEELIGAVQKFTEKTDESRMEYERCESSVASIIASIKV